MDTFLQLGDSRTPLVGAIGAFMGTMCKLRGSKTMRNVFVHLLLFVDLLCVFHGVALKGYFVMTACVRAGNKLGHALHGVSQLRVENPARVHL